LAAWGLLGVKESGRMGSSPNRNLRSIDWSHAQRQTSAPEPFLISSTAQVELQFDRKYEIPEGIGLIAEHNGSLQRMVQMKWWKRELAAVEHRP